MSNRFILIGHPVGHSVSPAIHHAAYELIDYDGEYGLEDCPDEDAVRAQVARIRSGELVGANITVPWKRLAYECADELDASAEQVGVANVLALNEAGKLIAYNTDAIGLADELRSAVDKSQALESGRTSVLIVGSGGATRGTVVACKMAGFEKVAVTARRFNPEQSRTTWPNVDAFLELGAEVLPWPLFDDKAVAQYLERSCLLVQATSAGMKGTEGGEALAELLPWHSYPSGACYDLVYNPPLTPFLRKASEEGHVSVGGLGMLVGQAAHAIRIWTGKLPERAPLMVAAQKALGL